MGERESGMHIEDKDTPVRVRRMHLLVHPGFLLHTLYRKSAPDDIGRQNAEQLLGDYLTKADSLGPDEVMVALAAEPKSSFRDDLTRGEAYATVLSQLKEKLGRRLVVLSKDFDIFNAPDFYHMTKTLLNARHYEFDENVLSEAYGETLALCVPDAAANMNKTGKLNNKTVIVSALTNARSTPPEDREKRNRPIVEDEHDGLKYS